MTYATIQEQARSLMRRHRREGAVVLSLPGERRPTASDAEMARAVAARRREAAAFVAQPGPLTLLRAAATVLGDHLADAGRRFSGRRGLTDREAAVLHVLAHEYTSKGGSVTLSGVFAQHAARHPGIFRFEPGRSPEKTKVVIATVPPPSLTSGQNPPGQADQAAAAPKPVAATPSAAGDVPAAGRTTAAGRMRTGELAALKAIAATPAAFAPEAVAAINAPATVYPSTEALRLMHLAVLSGPTRPLGFSPGQCRRGDVVGDDRRPGSNALVLANSEDRAVVENVRATLPAVLETRVEQYDDGLHQHGYVLYAPDASSAVVQCVLQDAPAEVFDAVVRASAALRPVVLDWNHRAAQAREAENLRAWTPSLAGPTISRAPEIL